MGNFVSFKTKYSSFVDSFFARFQNNTRMILVLLSRPHVFSAKFHREHGSSSPCFQLLEFQLARIHFNCSPRSKLRGRSTAVQLIPFGAETHRASPPTKSDPLPYLFQAWTTLEPSPRAWFWDRAFSSSCCTAFDESLVSPKRCQPCLTRSEPSRISVTPMSR